MNRRASPILLYPGAEESGDAIRDPLYSLPPARIRAQIAALREAGFRSVTLGEFLAYWQAEGESYVRSGDYEWMAMPDLPLLQARARKPATARNACEPAARCITAAGRCAGQPA